MREFIKASYMLGASSRNIDGSVSVCITAIPAGLTLKNSLSLAIRFSDMATLRAKAARVSRINGNKGDSKAFRFVFNFCPEIKERPVVQFISGCFPGLNPVSNMGQIFDRYRKGQAFSFRNNCFGDRMVDNFLEPGLLTTKCLKSTPGTSAAYRLEHAPLCGIASTDGFNMRPAISLSAAICGDFNDSQINAKNSFRSNRSGLINIDHTRDVPFSFDKQQVNLTLAKGKQFSLFSSARERNCLAPIERPKIDAIAFSKTEDSVVIRLCRPFAENSLSLAPILEFVGIRNFANASNCGLSGKIELFTQGVVMHFMQSKLAEDARIKGLLGQPITRFVAAFKRITQSALLRCVRIQLKIDNEFHSVKYRGILSTTQPQEEALPSPT